jgi:hypothetical protein
MAKGLVQEVFQATITGTPTLNSPTSFDGKNAWFTTGTSTHVIHIIEFWGPYLEDSGEMENATHPRWAEIAVDQITMNAMGPKVREIHTMTPGAKVVQFVRTEVGVTTAICEGDLRIRYSEITYEELSRTTVTKPLVEAPPSIWSLRSGSCIWMVKSTDHRGYQETPWHYFTVLAAGEDQCGADTQELQWWHRDTGAFLGTVQIPGRKQQSPRYIAYLQGKIYVSAFNEGGLFVFDAETGVYLTKININRDTAEMFVYGNFIYVSSRNGLFTRVDQNWGVTDIGGTAVRAYYVDLLDHTPVAISDADFWGISNDVIGRNDAGATAWEMDATGANAVYFRKDTRVGKKFNLYGTYQSVVFMPEKTYQYWTGTSMTTVTVPPHLLFSAAGVVKAVRFPGIYKGETDKSYGGVMAISTGPLRYKGDAI